LFEDVCSLEICAGSISKESDFNWFSKTANLLDDDIYIRILFCEFETLGKKKHEMNSLLILVLLGLVGFCQSTALDE